MIEKNVVKNSDIVVAIDVCNNLSIDILKDIEYFEAKKAENELNDSEYQDLNFARTYYDAIRTTKKYLETIK